MAGPKINLISTAVATSSRQSQFFLDLCRAFLDSGIPFWKLENQSLRTFLQKYTKEEVPSESTIRKTYLNICFEETLLRIRSRVAEKKIWISIDETTDAMGRYMANVIIGTMEATQTDLSSVFLLTTEEMERANSSTVAQLFTNSLMLLWPHGIRHDDVLLFVTDAAPYMKKAAKALKVLFPKMLHLTCLAHGLHRIAEEVRSLYPHVDKLVSNTKKVFLKSPSRIRVFKDMAPELSLPPQPVLTRWGTWISAAIYYSNNLDKIREVLHAVSEDEVASVREVKKLLYHEELSNDLAFITTHYSVLPEAILKLEKKGDTLVSSMAIFEDAVKQLLQAPGEKGSSVSEKCKRVLSANVDIEKIKKIRDVLKGESSVSTGMCPSEISCFKFAPITSVEVERSFSMMKNILSDKRLSMTVDTLKKHLVVACNQGK